MTTDREIEPLQRWEYARVDSARVMFSHAPEVQLEDVSEWDMVRQLGDNGWEMVTVNLLGTTGGVEMYFKRPRGAVEM